MFLKISQNSQEAVTLSCNFILKETLVQGFFCEFWKIFKNTFFTEHLWMIASILQQLLALYFAIIYREQLLSSQKSLVRKKSSSMYLTDFADLDFFFSIAFHFSFIFFGKYLFTLSVTLSVCFTLNSHPFCWLGDT